MFFGRENELQILEESYRSDKSEIFVTYGRRRIGKSRLLKEFTGDKKPLNFEGLEKIRTPGQLLHLSNSLKRQIKDPLLENRVFQSWDEVFTYFTERVLNKKQKTIIVLDEFQWLASRQTKLVSLLKWYWDNQWKDMKVMLILCGSISSYMIDKVIKSNALYGRISHQLHLKALSPKEASQMFRNKRNKTEILDYLIIFGGVPKYLEEIDLNRSFNQNLNRLCFQPTGSMADEFEKIFYSQFKEPQVYLTLCNLLKDRILSVSRLTRKSKLHSGGGMTRYLKNLEEAGIIRSYYPLSYPQKLKYRRYKLIDEYICFYFKYIKPNQSIIEESASENLFELLTSDSFETWIGFAFERYCLKHSQYLAKIMGFSDVVLLAAPYFGEKDEKFQIDLVFKRADKVITICEIKYSRHDIDSSVIAEVERKCRLFDLPRGYTIERALVTNSRPSVSLSKTEYFHHIVTIDDMF